MDSHSTDECILIIKSLMAKAESSGKYFIFSLVDIVGFFDKAHILDVMDSLDRVRVSKKAAKCWFMLNQNMRFK